MEKSNSLLQKYKTIQSHIDKDRLIKTSQLKELKLYYKDISALVENGYMQKIKHGYYQLVYDTDDSSSEARTIRQLYPDGILCMYTALFYYGYSDRTPLDWDITIDRNTSKARFHIDYPYVKPYFMEQKHMQYGVTEAEYEDCTLRIFDRDRLICECIRNENKMDSEAYNKAIQAYVKDPKKSITKLIDYAKKRNMLKKVKTRIGVWI
jgi:predicted transcriptional regulator of viral defense system